ncbi:SpoIIE family protein phosphatase [Actinorugispora endophytica]|uniref:Serine phosphatase RsbU (Regulator of sigma subunit) n=1 Tax=Actinorugispora endophytica TaxID=1605990 RepID=A0A4R6V461_9ACTN|nr:SpoIIE family protein phosphatase [Actinorugispora endophytica]TDQ55081.1 serine phosphatase RsbU (regulator of sigma subunit) [Actinorugispora endophytica]
MKVAHREFSPAPETVGEARVFVRDTLREWDVKHGFDDIILLVSELVTNAVIHAETTLELTVRRLPDGVEVVVADRVPRAVPKAGSLRVDTSPSLENTRNGGLGLALAGAIADSWGVSYSKEDKAVWFRIEEAESVMGQGARTSLVPPLPGHGRRRPAHAEPWARLDAALTARLSLPELLERTVDYARVVLGGDAAYIALATTDETEWELSAAVGLSSGQWRSFRSRTEETFPSSAPEPGPVINDDLMIARAHRGRLSAAGMRSLVTAPLIVDGRITGLIGVASKRVRHFGQTAADRLQEGADRIALTVERSRLAQVELTRRASLSFLAEASDLLSGTLDEQMTAALAAQLTTSRLGSWCVVHTTNDLGMERLAFATHRNENATDVLRDLVAALMPEERREPAPLWPVETLVAAGLDDELTLDLAGGPGISIPLTAHGRALGRITIGKNAGEEFPREEVDVADDLAQRVSSAMENARLYSNQTSMSEALQRSLLPAKEKQPAIPKVDHAVFYQPAGERTVVGGDFYDLFATDGRWCFAIGDVCGTGPEAAAVTGLARHTLRALAREGCQPAHIMHRLNLAILDENTTTRFLTMLYGEMVPIGGSGAGRGMRIRLVSAGHPLPLRLNRHGEVESLATSQPLLGAFEDVEFFTETVEVAPGDVLLAVTDGVTERRNGDEMLGDEGLTKIFSGCSGLTAQAVIARIGRDLEEFAPGGHTDDTAMMVLRFL